MKRRGISKPVWKIESWSLVELKKGRVRSKMTLRK